MGEIGSTNMKIIYSSSSFFTTSRLVAGLILFIAAIIAIVRDAALIMFIEDALVIVTVALELVSQGLGNNGW